MSGAFTTTPSVATLSRLRCDFMKLLAEVLKALFLQEDLGQALFSLEDSYTLEHTEEVLLRGLRVLPCSVVDSIHKNLGEKAIVSFVR